MRLSTYDAATHRKADVPGSFTRTCRTWCGSNEVRNVRKCHEIFARSGGQSAQAPGSSLA
jgi:hypothetical protein